MKKQTFDYHHDSQEKLGILAVNLGTPEQPTSSAVRKYLAEFLWDPRVVELPRIIWWCVLHGFILRFRPAKVAKAYRAIWTDQGSPLMNISKLQVQAIEQKLKNKFQGNVIVNLAMRYGKPGIRSGLTALREAGARRILIFPLYPQYSATTTASIFDEVTHNLRSWRWLPNFRFVNHYHDNAMYISALAKSVQSHWTTNKRADKLLISFHGLPQSCHDKGDPYFCHCQKTARLIAEKLKLEDDEWMLVFQSRFGKAPWLQPYADVTLKELAETGIKSVDIICPGFAADCLETLEEINIQFRKLFLDAGGESYHYIPALNDSKEHINALCEVLSAHMSGWPETMPSWNSADREIEEKKSHDRAINMGASN